ncbi:MAG: PQQ-binding-like beta-propeller repeat protein [Planctomycetes bacterium]|nr:PQQ-binding-like beta-propeller repeat protein [Planctomycetota bacterium]
MKNSRVLFLILLSSGWAHAENWPRFRGPTGQGLSSEANLPLHWSPSSNVVWKTAIPGIGWSSPIVWDDRIFLTSTTEDGVSCRVFCIDRSSGKMLWNREVFRQVPQYKQPKNSHATPTPVTDGERVYAVFSSGGIAALDFDGSIAWTNRDVAFYSRHGLGASPIVYKNLFIMPFDGSNRVAVPGKWPNNTDEEKLGWRIPWDKAFILAVDVKTGKRVWTAKRGMSRVAHTTPNTLEVNGKTQLISTAGDTIQGFDPETGIRIWSMYSEGEGLVSGFAMGGGRIFSASGYMDHVLRAVRTGGKGEVTESHIVWEARKGVPSQSSLLYMKPYLYAISDGGVATCYHDADGKVIRQNRIGGRHCASPVFADGHVYFLSESGETVIMKAGPQLEIIARNTIKERCQASIAVSHGHLFIRSDEHLFCIGI